MKSCFNEICFLFSSRTAKFIYSGVYRVNCYKSNESIQVIQNAFELESSPNDLKDVSHFISRINKRICGLLLNHEESNQVFEICIELIDKAQRLNEIFMKEKNGLDPIQALQMSTAQPFTLFGKNSCLYGIFFLWKFLLHSR